MKTSDAKKSQLDKFKDLAHEVEADDDDKRFEDRLRGIVKPTPKPAPKERE